MNTNNNREIEKKERKLSGFWRFTLLFAAILVTYLLFGSGNNIIQAVKAKMEIEAQQKQKEKYLEEIDEMNRSIEMITSDPDTLEKIAREKFHFAAPGEDVYVIE